MKRAIIVDLTQFNIGIPVVRAIVPGLETLEVGRLDTKSELLWAEEQNLILKTY